MPFSGCTENYLPKKPGRDAPAFGGWSYVGEGRNGGRGGGRFGGQQDHAGWRLAGALGWLAQINWVGLIGVLVAVIGLLANIYFQVRRDRRESAESAARIEAIRGRCDVEQP